MVNAITSFFHSLYWFILKFIQYTLTLIVIVYLLFKIPTLIDYLRDEYIPVYRENYIKADYDIGKVEQEFLYDTLSQIEMNDAEALFISCTALPVLNIIDKLEKKINKPVLSSNQALIWDSLESIGKNKSVIGFGKLFNIN